MRGIYHERIGEPRLGELLEELAGDPDPARAAMVRNLRHRHERAVKLPVEFAQRLAFAESRGSTIWRVARRENDFASFLPALEGIIELKREEAELVGYDGEAYDALLDEFEPGMTAARLEPLLGELRDETLSAAGRDPGRRAAAAGTVRGTRLSRRCAVGLHDRRCSATSASTWTPGGRTCRHTRSARPRRCVTSA